MFPLLLFAEDTPPIERSGPMKPIVIADVDSDENQIPFTLPGGVTVKVPRLDYIDEDTYDALNTDLEALDTQQQLIAVANDVAASPVGAKLPWEPLLPAAKEQLTKLGVEIVRVTENGVRRDEVSAPSEDVVKALKPYSDKRPQPFRKRGREIALTMLKHVVSEDEYAMFEKLRVGQLDQILTEWRKHSSATPGE